MERREITCPRCRQLNIRYSGASGWLRNPLWSSYCTACQTHLESGARNTSDRVAGLMSWGAIYGMHLFVGAGGGVLALALVVVIWPAILTLPVTIRVAPVLAGMVLGGVAAERARRRGALLASKRGKVGKRKASDI